MSLVSFASLVELIHISNVCDDTNGTCLMPQGHTKMLQIPLILGKKKSFCVYWWHSSTTSLSCFAPPISRAQKVRGCLLVSSQVKPNSWCFASKWPCLSRFFAWFTLGIYVATLSHWQCYKASKELDGKWINSILTVSGNVMMTVISKTALVILGVLGTV